MPERSIPHVRVRHLVDSKGSRDGAAIKLIIVHDTEGPNRRGLSDLLGLGNFFAILGHEASAHVATDAEGSSARYIRDKEKAWHVSKFNPVTLGIEQVGFASQAHWPDAQLRETARWIAYWSRLHGIPIQKGRISGLNVTRWGVMRHSELGILGGGHHDPGKPYPLHQVLEYARHYRWLQAA